MDIRFFLPQTEYDISMNREALEKLGIQFAGIVLTALIAAGLSFIQSVMTSSGLSACPAPDLAETAGLAAGLRGALVAISYSTGIKIT